MNKQRVASRGSEAVGLSDAQIEGVKNLARDEDVSIADKHYRRIRNRPMLMLHILNLNYEPDELSATIRLVDQVPAIGIAFPGGDFTTTVDYVFNKVKLNEIRKEGIDDPDNEDDYDA